MRLAASPFREGRGARLKIPRNGLRKLLEFAEYKSFPMAVIRFSRVSSDIPSSRYNPTFCPIARKDIPKELRAGLRERIRPPDPTDWFDNKILWKSSPANYSKFSRRVSDTWLIMPRGKVADRTATLNNNNEFRASGGKRVSWKIGGNDDYVSTCITPAYTTRSGLLERASKSVFDQL